MFVFLTCIRHPSTSQDYAAVSALFERCARSVSRQTAEDWRLIAVCNRRPEIDFTDHRIVYIEVPIAAPPPSRRAALLDKARKRLIGLQEAVRLGARHIMMLDADDLVSRHLVNAIQEDESRTEQLSSYFLSKGYLIDHARGVAQLKFGMHRNCGSTIVYAIDAIREEFDLTSGLGTSELLNANADREELLIDLIGNHREPVRYLVSKNRRIRRLPISAVAWVVNNGENINRARDVPPAPPITTHVADLFGVERKLDHTESAGVLLRLRSSLVALLSFAGARLHETYQLRRLIFRSVDS